MLDSSASRDAAQPFGVLAQQIQPEQMHRAHPRRIRKLHAQPLHRAVEPGNILKENLKAFFLHELTPFL